MYLGGDEKIFHVKNVDKTFSTFLLKQEKLVIPSHPQSRTGRIQINSECLSAKMSYRSPSKYSSFSYYDCRVAVDILRHGRF